MRKLALLLPLALLTSLSSCSMEREYETRTYLDDLNRKSQGRVNAFGRDLEAISATIDRHLFNYSPTDPTVNYPTTQTVFEKPVRFVGDVLSRFNIFDW